MAEEQNNSSATGQEMDPKVASLLAYLLGLIGGIVFYSISKNPDVRFHSMQSIIASVAVAIGWVAFTILGFVIPFLFMIGWILSLGVTALWILLMIKAYQGERYKLPVIGDMAEKYAK